MSNIAEESYDEHIDSEDKCLIKQAENLVILHVVPYSIFAPKYLTHFLTRIVQFSS